MLLLLLSCACRLQPVRATREKQLVLWKQLILEYHRTHGLPIFQPFSSALFENVKISRTSIYCGGGSVCQSVY